MTRTLSRPLRASLATALGAALTVTTLTLAPVATAAPAPAPAGKAEARDRTDAPLVFAHRGASGYRPEHTLAAYRLAIRLGADYIEPDVVPTKDGVLVARHENEISGTTDVAEHPEFADRRATKVIDGVSYTGWFTEDFTLAELKTLRAVERLPEVRPDNTRYDGRFEVPTVAEVLELADQMSTRGRTIGVAPETKHPTYFDSIGLSLEEPLLRTLKQAGLRSAKDKVMIQSFEVSNLQELDERTRLPIVQLLGGSGAPYDQVVAGTGVTYASLATPSGLRGISRYADTVSPDKNLVLPRNPVTGATGAPSALVDDAHRVGLDVVVYTIRDENVFMATNFRRGTDPNALGDVRAEIQAFLDAGVDGFFADHTDSAVDAVEDWLARR